MTEQLRLAEQRLVTRYTALLDVIGRLSAAMEAGNWHYAWEKAREVTRRADRLAEAFTAPGQTAGGQQVMGFREPTADPRRVLGAVRADGGHLPAVVALHPAPSGEAPR